MKSKKSEEVRLRKLLRTIDERLVELENDEKVIKEAIKLKQSANNPVSLLEVCNETTDKAVASTSTAVHRPTIPPCMASTSKCDNQLNIEDLDLDVPETLSMLARGGRTLRRGSEDDDDEESWFDAVMNL